jgi:lipopolysaccharide exporter
MADGPAPLSLTARTARGAGWVVGWRFATRILGTVNTLVLVKLLAPGDFGLVALGTTFSQALDGFLEIGVAYALIRETSLDRAMYDTGFTLSLIRGVISALLIVCCAWPVAQFFSEPRLLYVLLALAAGMLISSFENIGVIDFQRDIAFEKEFGLQLAPRILGIAACIVVAVVWRTYWALVVGIMTTRCTRTLFTYLMHSYRPHLSLRAWRRIAAFSFWTWMLAWITLIRDRVDNFVLGRMLGAIAVGEYTVARDVGFITSTELVMPICRALFPGLTQVRNRGADVADAYFRAISMTLVLALPASVGIALVADPMIRLAVGARWVASIPLLQIFALVGIFRVVTFVGTTLLTVYAMLEVQFHSTTVILLIRFVLLIVLIDRFGLVGSGIAVAMVAIIEEVYYLIVTFRRFKLRPMKLLTTNARSVAATVVMTATIIATTEIHGPISSLIQLLALVAGGAVIYSGVLLAMWQAAGRPWGAEAQVLALLREATRAAWRYRSR